MVKEKNMTTIYYLIPITLSRLTAVRFKLPRMFLVDPQISATEQKRRLELGVEPKGTDHV